MGGVLGIFSLKSEFVPDYQGKPLPETTPHPEYRHRSIFTWLALFWVAMTLPRVWFLCRSGMMFQEFYPALDLMRIGFLRDGLLIGLIAISFQCFRGLLIKLPVRIYSRLFTVILWLMSIGLALLMLNAEVLHQAGTPLELEYLNLLTDAHEGPLLFVTNWSAVSILILHLIIIPVLYFRLCARARVLKLEWFMMSRSAFLISLSIIFGGVTAWKETQADETRAAVADNYLVRVFTQLATKRDISGEGTDIKTILNTDPLPKAGEVPQPWYFPDPQYPLVKATAHHLCVAGIWKGAVCQEDHDHDGSPVIQDCNDWDPKIHPGAVDKPGDGIDSDCSGVDADPPNVIFIHFESARAANFGSLNGFKRPSTPRFDRLAKDGVLFTNAYCNGIQTRYSIVPMYCSTYDRMSGKWICRYNPDTELLSIPGILRGRGYQTMYVHGGDNNFSSHSARLWQWFEDSYDKGTPPFKDAKRFNWGLKDKDLFKLTYEMLKKREDKRPFYLAIATLSLHFPMGLPDPAYEYIPGNTYDNTVSNILRYADDALADFVEQILADKQFENTIILVAADHGINGSVPTVLDEEVVWVPILLIGKKWNIPPGRVEEVRQLADLGPTVLDRLGIEVPNPFVGQSLLRRFGDRVPQAFFSTANGGAAAGIRKGKWKYWTRFGTGAEYLFDAATDREGKKNLANDPRYREMTASFFKDVKSVWGENNTLIDKNRIWNWKYWTKKP